MGKGKKIPSIKSLSEMIEEIFCGSLYGQDEKAKVRAQYLEKKNSELGLYLPPGTIVAVRQVQDRGRVQSLRR